MTLTHASVELMELFAGARITHICKGMLNHVLSGVLFSCHLFQKVDQLFILFCRKNKINVMIFFRHINESNICLDIDFPLCVCNPKPAVLCEN